MNNATKTTPGPWRARISRKHQDEIPVEATDAESIIARVNGFPQTKEYVGSGNDDPNANARLIAASPDAYRIMERLKEFIDVKASKISFSALIGDDTLAEAVRAYFKKLEG